MTYYVRIFKSATPDNTSMVTNIQSLSPRSKETADPTNTRIEKINTLASCKSPVRAWPIPSESDCCIQTRGPTRIARASVEISKEHPHFAGELRPRSLFAISRPVDCPPREFGIIDFRVPIFCITIRRGVRYLERISASG
jgi:hypothetical protein